MDVRIPASGALGLLLLVLHAASCGRHVDPPPPVFASCQAQEITGLCTEFVSAFFAGDYVQSLAKQNCEQKFLGQFVTNVACDHSNTVPGYCQIDNFQGAEGATVYRYYYTAMWNITQARQACADPNLGVGTYVEASP